MTPKTGPETAGSGEGGTGGISGTLVGYRRAVCKARETQGIRVVRYRNGVPEGSGSPGTPVPLMGTGYRNGMPEGVPHARAVHCRLSRRYSDYGMAGAWLIKPPTKRAAVAAVPSAVGFPARAGRAVCRIASAAPRVKLF